MQNRLNSVQICGVINQDPWELGYHAIKLVVSTSERDDDEVHTVVTTMNNAADLRRGDRIYVTGKLVYTTLVSPHGYTYPSAEIAPQTIIRLPPARTSE